MPSPESFWGQELLWKPSSQAQEPLNILSGWPSLAAQMADTLRIQQGLG